MCARLCMTYIESNDDSGSFVRFYNVLNTLENVQLRVTVTAIEKKKLYMVCQILALVKITHDLRSNI